MLYEVITDYAKLDKAIQEQIKLAYPFGFSENLITFYNKDNHLVSALPFETDDKYYLVKMSETLAEKIIEEDDDYDSSGFLKSSAKEDLSLKHPDFMQENNEDDEEENDDYRNNFV